MTFPEWQSRTTQVRAQAERVRRMIAGRAQVAFNQAFELHPSYSNAYSCFHLAHNWQTLPNLTHAQRQACRYVLHLERKQWEPSNIADRIIKKMWERIV